MNKIAIIPARIGSKRIPKKNIKLFHGKPIISYILDVINRSTIFDEVHVSTESAEVLGVLNTMGVNVKFKRPDYLAEDNIPLMEVIRYVLIEYEKIGLTFDQVWLFLPCSPFITQVDIVNAIKVYENHGMEYPLMTVKEYETTIQKAFIADNNFLKSVNPNAILKQSQQLSKFYHDSGNFAIFPRKYIDKEDHERVNINFLGYEISRERSIDIDTPYDWALAEKMYEILP